MPLDPARDDDKEAALRRLVRRELTRHAHNRRTSTMTGAFSTTATLGIAIAFHAVYGDPAIIAWGVVACLPHLVRLALNPLLEQASEAALDLGLRLVFLNMLALALLSAAGMPLLFRPGEHLFNGIATVWAMMMISGASTRPLAERRTLVAFNLPMGAVLALTLCLAGQPAYWIAGAMVALYAVAQTFAGFDAHRLRAEALRQSILNRWLAEELAAQVKQALAARREAEQAAEEKSRFLAAASHDLRQPAHAIGLLCDSLRRTYARTGHDRDFDLLTRSVGELNASLQAMLDVSRLDAGALEAHLEPVDLSEVFALLHARFVDVANAKGLALRFRASGVRVQADRQMLLRLLGNLVENALKFTARGGVLVAARGRGRRLRIEVRDSGVGIAPELHGRVFDEFFQVNNPSRERSQGIGLGLSIVRRLALHMGMELRLRSAAGLGSRFELSCREVHSAPAAAPEPQGADAFAEVLAGRRILVVDNEPAILRAASALLESCGAVVHVARGPEEACALLRSGTRMDLAFVDFRLDGVADGIQLAGQLGALHDGPLPVVIVTGDTSASEIQRLHGSGMEVVYKPLDGPALLAVAGKVLAAASVRSARGAVKAKEAAVDGALDVGRPASPNPC